MLLGNKSDLNNLKEIDVEEEKVFLKKKIFFYKKKQRASETHGLTFFEVSAKENKNIIEAFVSFAEKLAEKK